MDPAFTYTTSRIGSGVSSAGQGGHGLGQCPEPVPVHRGSGKDQPCTVLQAAPQALRTGQPHLEPSRIARGVQRCLRTGVVPLHKVYGSRKVGRLGGQVHVNKHQPLEGSGKPTY